MTELPARSPIGTVFNFLFGYDGRVSRRGYWLGLMAATAAAGFISGIADQLVPGTGDIGRYLVVASIIGAFVWIHSAVTIKRLHDRDRSGAWYWLYGLLPAILFIGAIYFYALHDLLAASILSVLFAIVVAWVIIELGCLRGTDGPNRFGPPP